MPKTPPATTQDQAPEEPTFTAQTWALGNGPLQVPLAGLLASDPSLQDALLTPSDWQARLDQYLSSPPPGETP